MDSTQKVRFYASKPTRRQQPKAVGGASEHSERGRSALFKNPLFFLRDAILKIFLRLDNFCPRLGTKKTPCYIEAAQNFFEA